jgi:hypothetical protein
MTKMIAKSDLPTKLCKHCQRPMVWRKKWRNNWDEVAYCSDACRRKVHPGSGAIKKS